MILFAYNRHTAAGRNPCRLFIFLLQNVKYICETDSSNTKRMCIIKKTQAAVIYLNSTAGNNAFINTTTISRIKYIISTMTLYAMLDNKT